ncbi:Transport-associated protein [Paraburkholderia tropica]|uniref:BON domain-containing protein n=1 Tax=Paraburkholderia tropica TaxID=92647 RepID=UPI001CAB1437|nr:BON domain-containing protein [Paraburkholderia tropica]CAG9216694.1 Transport-associated protein [Paraburkholderia tropica]
MKACSFTSLIVVVGCVTSAPNVHAQAASAGPMTSSSVVTPGQPAPTNKQLARDVRKALSKAPHFAVSNVFVTARGGVVTLSGSVPDGPQIQQASDVAMRVPGVTSVNNHLNIYTRGY